MLSLRAVPHLASPIGEEMLFSLSGWTLHWGEGIDDFSSPRTWYEVARSNVLATSLCDCASSAQWRGCFVYKTSSLCDTVSSTIWRDFLVTWSLNSWSLILQSRAKRLLLESSTPPRRSKHAQQVSLRYIYWVLLFFFLVSKTYPYVYYNCYIFLIPCN